MTKRNLLLIALPLFFLLTSIVSAGNISIAVNVTPPLPPPPAPSMVFAIETTGIVLGAGGLLFLLRAFLAEESPEDKMKLAIGAVIVLLVILGAISSLQGLL
jgi:hypothetical protein